LPFFEGLRILMEAVPRLSSIGPLAATGASTISTAIRLSSLGACSLTSVFTSGFFSGSGTKPSK